MAWTYGGNPGGNPVDTVRFHIGDVVQAPTSLSDAEVTFLIGEAGGDPLRAAATAADLWAGRFAGLSASSKSVGDLTIAQDHAGAATRLYSLATRLRARLGGIAGPLIFDTRPSVFAVGMDDNPANSAEDMARWF
jgi:hypothetical protein